jgi:prevent-host-death family protein
MVQTISVTDARNKFPALVRQIADQDDPVVVTSRNQPQVVLVPWATYQQQQALQSEGAEHRLQTLVQALLTLIATLQEAYQPGSYALTQGTQELWTMTRQAWKICRLLEIPRRHLASTIADGLAGAVQNANGITVAQLAQLAQSVALLQRKDLTQQEVAGADQALAAVGLDAMLPVGDDLVDLYETTAS